MEHTDHQDSPAPPNKS